jgi:hypothetical protein
MPLHRRMEVKRVSVAYKKAVSISRCMKSYTVIFAMITYYTQTNDVIAGSVKLL